MSDKLENFIKDNKRSFEEEPSRDLWKNIEQSLPEKKKINWFSRVGLYKWSAAVAVVCVVLMSIYIFRLKTNDQVSKNGQPANTTISPGLNNNDISIIGPDYAGEAIKISQAIKKQQEQLRDLAATQPHLYKQFAEDLTTLDSAYQLLKDRAAQAPGRETIVRAMIQNLQMQAELLNKQLSIIQEYNNKTANNEKTNYRPA